jgi:uncharacterized membrane protein
MKGQHSETIRLRNSGVPMKQFSDFAFSGNSTKDMQAEDGRSTLVRNALLVTGASAVALGLWRRDRLGWPAVLGGSVLLARGAALKLPQEFSWEVSQTIDRPAADIMAYFRELKNWPLFMKPIRSEGANNFYIDQLDSIRWPEGAREGIARITDSSESSLRWKSEFGGQLHECSVELRPAPGDRGTEIHWRVRSKSRKALAAELLGMSSGTSGEQMARESLRALKQLLEAGEMATTDGQAHGRRGLKGRMERAVFRESVDEKPRRIQPHSVEQERAAS